MTYPADFRRKVMTIKEQEKLTYAETAERFGIGIADVARWRRCPEPKKTRNKPATKIGMEALARDVAERPDAYQYERAARLGAGQRGVSAALKRLGAAIKKTLPLPGGRRRTASLPGEDGKA